MRDRRSIVAAAVHVTGDTVDLRRDTMGPQAQGPARAIRRRGRRRGHAEDAFPEGDKQGVESPAKSVKPARVFVLASAEFFANPLAGGREARRTWASSARMNAQPGGDSAASPCSRARTPSSTITGFDSRLSRTRSSGCRATPTFSPSAPSSSASPAWSTATKKSSRSRRTKPKSRFESRSRIFAPLAKTSSTTSRFSILGIPALFAAYGLIRWRSRMAARAHVSLA